MDWLWEKKIFANAISELAEEPEKEAKGVGIFPGFTGEVCKIKGKMLLWLYGNRKLGSSWKNELLPPLSLKRLLCAEVKCPVSPQITYFITRLIHLTFVFNMFSTAMLLPRSFLELR